MSVIRATIIGVTLLASGPAMAQQRQAQPQRQEDLAQIVDRNVRTCIGQAREAARVRSCLDGQRATIEPRLEDAVRRIYAAQPSADRRAAAEGVQAAWAEYRNRRCRFAGSNPERGEDAAVDEAACLLQFTLGRVVEVEALLQPPAPPPQQQQQQQQRR